VKINGQEEAPIRTTVRKIVYFDEGSAADYVQIVNDGELKSVVELFSENSDSGDAEAKAKVHLSSGLLLNALGLGARVEAGGSVQADFNNGSVAKSIVTNTLLTDFLDAIEQREGEIEKFEGYSIEPIKDTLSNIALLTPYLSMLRGGQGIPAGDFIIAADRLDSTLRDAKGYFEFLGIQKESKVILRFNNTAFKNNYKAQDLFKMRLVVYAIPVGSCSLDALRINEEFHTDGASVKDNPVYQWEDTAEMVVASSEPLKMYDALLAGVDVHD
jgi:hypothetical protein